MKLVKTLLIIIILFLLFIGGKNIYSKYTTQEKPTNLNGLTFNPTQGEPVSEVIEKPKATHMKTPTEVRGIYVTANSFLHKPFKT